MESKPRYTVEYYADQLLLQADCPVHVKKVQCTRDGLTGRLILQARYVNRSKRTVETIVIQVSLRDEAGQEVSAIHNLRMTGLYARGHRCFGDDKTIILPRDFASLQIVVEQVGFTDGFFWMRKPDSLPVPIEPPVRIGGCVQPARFAGYWYCGCGMVNPDSLSQCSYCCGPIPQLTAAMLEAQERQEKAPLQEPAAEQKKPPEQKPPQPAARPEDPVSEEEAMEEFPAFSISPELQRAAQETQAPRRKKLWTVLIVLAVLAAAAAVIWSTMR